MLSGDVYKRQALQFLMIEDDDLTDESAYLILKDFLDDYDQMLLFKKAIGKKNALVDASGNTTCLLYTSGIKRTVCKECIL